MSYDPIITELKNQLIQLTSSEKYPITEVRANRTKHNGKAVYSILTPSSEIVYVGKTADLCQRMQDHINTNSSSDLNMMLKKYTELPQDSKNYQVQYVRIMDDRKRGQVESFVISILNPKLNKLG